MKIAVVGCGAVGGVIAACLTRAGHQVTPVTGNQPIADALGANGFRLSERDGASMRIPASGLPVVAVRAGDGPFDLAVIATPATALQPALTGIMPCLTASAIIMTCQNGLPEERAVALAGARVVGCVVGWGATMTAPAVYRRTSSGRLQIGPATPACAVPAGLSVLLETVAPVELVEDLAGVRWSKLAINCVTSVFGAIGGAPLGVLLRRASVRRLALEVFAEVAAVAALEGVAMKPVAGTLDITKIAMTPRERRAGFAPTLLLKHLVLLAVGFKFRRMRSSMLAALERGRPLEIDYLNGEIVERGARHQFPTPFNRALVETVRRIERRELSSAPALLDRIYGRLSSK